MLNKVRRLFGREVCYLCRRKTGKAQRYYNDQREIVFVCDKCRSYAERRAMVKTN